MPKSRWAKHLGQGTWVAVCLVLGACAIAPLPVPEPHPVIDATPPQKPTLLTLEYGNRSAKASIQIDLSGNDVQLEMTGSQTPRDSLRHPAALVPTAGATSHAGTPTSAPARAAPDDPGIAQVKRIVDSTVLHSGPDKLQDSSLRKVVQHIRKAQELFYAGRYPEAEDNARRANEIKPTAEGLALAGSIAWVRKNRELARRNWLQARELDPDFPGLGAMLDSLPLANLPESAR